MAKGSTYVNEVANKDTPSTWRRAVSAVHAAPLKALWRVIVVGVLLVLVFLAGRLSVEKPRPIGAEEGGSSKLRQNNSGVEMASKAAADDVKDVETDLATKHELQMARSEMGTLIARNHDEIDQLRRIGQRDYDEFTLTLGTGPQKVAIVQVELSGTNPKKDQFTVKILADGKSFEKKNRSVNDPIFFYTSGNYLPLEVVVNKVTKTTVSGYLSVPKENTPHD
jgi:hypothetical protein